MAVHQDRALGLAVHLDEEDRRAAGKAEDLHFHAGHRVLAAPGLGEFHRRVDVAVLRPRLVEVRGFRGDLDVLDQRGDDRVVPESGDGVHRLTITYLRLFFLNSSSWRSASSLKSRERRPEAPGAAGWWGGGAGFFSMRTRGSASFSLRGSGESMRVPPSVAPPLLDELIPEEPSAASAASHAEPPASSAHNRIWSARFMPAVSPKPCK